MYICTFYIYIYIFIFNAIDEIKNIFEKYFDLEQNSVDRRLIINRSRKLKMYRVWIQGKFKRKPLEDTN